MQVKQKPKKLKVKPRKKKKRQRVKAKRKSRLQKKVLLKLFGAVKARKLKVGHNNMAHKNRSVIRT